MPKEDKYTFPKLGITSMYVNRNTGEEVEIIAFNQVEDGARNDNDWVTYIDSKGEEHIREHLNSQLDFKPSDKLMDMFNKIMSPPEFKPMELPKLPELPSSRNCRIFEVAKDLIIHKDYKIDAAIEKAKELVDKIG